MSPRRCALPIAAAAVALACASAALAADVRSFPVAAGSGPHDVAASPAPGGPVYYTGQRNGTLGIVDPATGRVEEVKLGARSAPHGVIVGPDGAPWITDSGQNAIVRVDPATRAVKAWPLPGEAARANLNTATFDRKGRIWFTGQSGWYGRLDPARDDLKVWPAPRGYGPYGIATTPSGEVWYASLAGNHIARIDVETGVATPVDPPTARQGARRVWPDSKGRLWVSYWNTGQVGMYDPAAGAWREWRLPGANPQAYSVWVDERDGVWLTEWSSNAIVRFDPSTQRFDSFPSDRARANVRQMLGRAGEAWGAESGTDRLVVVPTGRP
ncbi:Virginiamycin B lyase [Burkholderiales bacterium]|nr:Virginiamycin B lyase [Burkholderiales bacterium]